MASIEGLNLRGSRWYLRIVIPEDLVAVFGTTRKNIALGTSDRKEAILHGTVRKAEWLAEFGDRRGRPIPYSASAVRLGRSDLPRSSGADVIGHCSSEPATLKAPKTLRDVFQRWKTSGEKDRSADTVTAMERTLRQFESQHPQLPLEDITRDMGDKYRAWLRKTCNTSKTASDRLTGIKTLLKFAWQVLEWLPRQPWQGLAIEVTTENPRRPWSTTELQTLFAAPTHAAYALPSDKNAGADAAYWIPLLALFTGARAGELCQLHTQDVRDVDGMPSLQITDDGENQKVKSKAGRRTIPLHSELVRLGFIEYVDRVRAQGSVSLWPHLPLREGKPSDYFGRWFLEHRKALDLPGKGGPSMHYFRHTVRPLMRRAGFSSAIQDKITGHETRGSIGDIVYDGVLLEELQPAVEAIAYPFLKLPRVYTAK